MDIIKFTDELKKINGANLILTGLYDSDKRFLAVFEELSPETLLNNSAVFRKISGGKYIPVFLTRKHLLTSGDVFPAEIYAMKNCRVIYGSLEIFKELVIEKENLRLAAEQKFKGALIRMNLLLLEKGMKPVFIRRILLSAYEEILGGLISLLVFKQSDKLFSVSAFEEIFNIKLDIIKDISETGLKKLNKEKLLFFLKEFYDLAQLLADTADKAQ